MVQKILSGISFGLCLIALGLTVGAIHADNWVNYEQSDTIDYEVGIFWITNEDNDDNTQAESEGLSWYAVKQQYCELDDNADGDNDSYKAQCDMATDMHRAGLIYYICQLVSIVVMVKYMVCQLAMLFDRDGGHKYVQAAKAITWTVTTIIGFASWWGTSQAQFDGDCDADDFLDKVEDGDRWDVCAGNGATVGILAFIFMLLAGLFGIAHGFMQNNELKLEYSDEVPFLCGPKIHLILCAVLLTICVVLSFVGLFYPNWIYFEIEQGDSNDDYTGGLFTIDEYPIGSGIKVDDFSYDGIAVDICDLNDDTTLCKTFEPLMDSGRLYLQVEIVNLFFLFQLAAFLGHVLISGRDMSHPVLNVAFPHLAWIVHLVAIVSWIQLSEVKFEMDDCNNDDTASDEAYDVCIKIGPVLSLVQLFLQILLAVYFTAVYGKRGKADIHESKI